MKYIDADLLMKEINRLYQEHSCRDYCDEACSVLDQLEDFIDSIQQEQPELDLQKEIENYYYDNFAFISSAHTPTKDIVSDIATHFYELGQKDAANKFDEIEYNRQRAEEEMSDKTLDEAAEEYVYGDPDYSDLLRDAFKAGAKWMAGQGAQLIGRIKVNGMGQPYLPPEYIYLSGLELKEGDRVIVQIRKKED